MPATYAEALIAEYKQTVLHLTDQLHELQANVNLLKSRVTSLSESNANLLLNVENKRCLIQELTDKVEKLEGDLAFARAPEFPDVSDSAEYGYGDDALRVSELVLSDSVDFIKKAVVSEVRASTKELGDLTEELRTLRTQSKSNTVRGEVNSLCQSICDFRKEVEACFSNNAVCIADLTQSREDCVCRLLPVHTAYDKLFGRFDSTRAVVRGAALSNSLRKVQACMDSVTAKLFDPSGTGIDLTAFSDADMKVAESWVKHFKYNAAKQGLPEAAKADPAQYCYELCLCLKARTGWLFTKAAFEAVRAGTMAAIEDVEIDLTEGTAK